MAVPKLPLPDLLRVRLVEAKMEAWAAFFEAQAQRLREEVG